MSDCVEDDNKVEETLDATMTDVQVEEVNPSSSNADDNANDGNDPLTLCGSNELSDVKTEEPMKPNGGPLDDSKNCSGELPEAGKAPVESDLASDEVENNAERTEDGLSENLKNQKTEMETENMDSQLSDGEDVNETNIDDVNGKTVSDGAPERDSVIPIATKEEALSNDQDDEVKEEESNRTVSGTELLATGEMEYEFSEQNKDALEHNDEIRSSGKSFLLPADCVDADESGSEEEQTEFMKELETFHKERCLEFKPPKFYGEPLNCLKLWRAVIRLGGYEQVTSCKLWRQVGESFKPPKTCTTVSWTFRCFYEKALLEYEKFKLQCGELPFSDGHYGDAPTVGNQVSVNQASGSGRARRDSAARAMQGWHSQRLLGNGEVGDPIIKDKNSTPLPRREKQIKSIGLLKRKKSSPVDRSLKVARLKSSKPQVDSLVVDIGPPADWVKVNVHKTKDCFEVYALVPGLLREEVRVQSDPAGRLVISGQPEQLDNPWGVTPFKKVVTLPSRIDPHQTSAVVTLQGQLFVRVPFEPSDL
ncbi:AT-rich interactive domain-containing protein 6-like isoform X2 [Impatiens glandulifera]|uniref:AT-rich interactive domain-containing protein 6-like isoform X2 n=1 Tax=Impatiens glandulifera TaxID=253017 RepID=UPI001FB0CD09|nr:AT-rich interactive domain-containing protein 6-like isoform X2 [Impatiens glandulifera]